MKKKVISILLCLAVIATSLAGCNSKSATGGKDATTTVVQDEKADKTPDSSEQDVITLTWAVFETDNYTAEVWQHIIDAFEEKNSNIKIEKVLMTGDSRPQFLKTMLSAGNMPDINIDPVDLATTDGIYAEVPEELLSKYESTSIVAFNGKKTLIPAYKALRNQVYYHKDQFEKAGIKEVPTTWDEFIEACDKLVAAGYTPLMGAGASDIWATSFGYWTGIMNSEIMEAYPNFNEDVISGKRNWSDPVIENGLKKWQDLIKAGYYHKGSMSFSYTQAQSEFQNGSSAMFMDGAWAAPGLDNSDKFNSEDFGVFVAPTPSGSKAYCTMPQYWGVSETCKNKEAAFKFCEFVLGGNEEIYKYYLQADGTFSVTQKPVTYEMGPIQTKFVDNYKDYKLVGEIMKVAGDTSMPSGFEDFTCKSLQNIFTGSDVSSELKTWDTEFDRLMAEKNK